MAALVGEKKVSNDIILSDHRRNDFVMGMNPAPTIPFGNPRKTERAAYKVELGGASNPHTTSMREPLEEWFRLNTLQKVEQVELRFAKTKKNGKGTLQLSPKE